MAADAQAAEYCLFFVTHWTTCMNRSEWSSWVQALGSIAAILAAALIAGAQHAASRRLAREAEQEERRRILQIALQLVGSAEGSVLNIGRRKINPLLTETLQNRLYDQRLLLQIQDDLDSIPALSMPSAEAVRALTAARRQLVEAVALAEYALRPGTLDEHRSGSDALGQPWLPIHGELRDSLNRLRSERIKVDDPSHVGPSEFH